ncbi:MAG: hypothetical protein JKX78_07510 [Alteromonadaceae bacterium]|nr:hypothetical protein [Alteromonadaceae bacterium]
MNNISLMKTTILVLIITSASFFVSAENTRQSANIIKKEAKKIASVPLTYGAKGEVSFSMLIEKFDSNKDGVLNQSEVAASKSELLNSVFKEMDKNNDLAINEVEFNHFQHKTSKENS